MMSSKKIVRLSKIALTLMLASLVLMVTLNNILDYHANFEYVQHVLSMDTIASDSTLMYRAIHHATYWHVSYWIIIALEGLIGLVFAMSSLALWRARHEAAEVFNSAKKWFYVGATLAFLLWFFGFMVVAGEWFLMWQSEKWNAQDSAFQLYMSVLAVLIYVNQTDVELNNAEPAL